MNKLKFSHDYEKLPSNWEGTQAILIGILYIPVMGKLKKRLPRLVRADTKFRGEKGFYPLEFNEGILLTFFHINSTRLFTTIRRYTEEKGEYYNENLNKIFELIKVEEK